MVENNAAVIENVIAITAIIITIICSVTSLIVNYNLKLRTEKREKRAIVSIGILKNTEDDIDDRLNNPTCSWFLYLNKLHNYAKKETYYLSIVLNNNNLSVYNCKLKINYETIRQTEEYYIGTLGKRQAIVPLNVEKNLRKISVILNYITEENEVMIYKLIIDVDKGKKLVNEQELWGKRLKKPKEKNIMEVDLYDEDDKKSKYNVIMEEKTESFINSHSGNEIKKYLKGQSLNY